MTPDDWTPWDDGADDIWYMVYGTAVSFYPVFIMESFCGGRVRAGWGVTLKVWHITLCKLVCAPYY